MKRLFVLLALSASTLYAGAGGYEDLRDAAERSFAEKSYGEALRLYTRALEQPELKPADRRWVEFRLADGRWREQAASAQADPSRFNAARQTLEKMIRDVPREEAKDRLWAEVHESLADSYWRRDGADWPSAWPHYEAALDWWAGQSDLDAARPRYLAMVQRCAWPGWADSWYRYGNLGNRLPLAVAENALTIARTPEDRAWANYLIALCALYGDAGPDPNRVPACLEAALAAGRGTAWYDDALFQYAQWMEQQGRAVVTEEGALVRRPDFVQAAENYRRLLAEFEEGDTRYYKEAQGRLAAIVDPALSVGVESFFLPGSEVSFFTSWRNVKRITFTLYALDLVRDVKLEGTGDRTWLETVNPARLRQVHELEKDTQDDGTHQPGRDTLKVGQALEPGAYLLVAAAGGTTAREILLVTDAALALKTGGAQSLAWFCQALDGAPLAGSSIAIWQRYRENDRYHWRLIPTRAGAPGLVEFAWPGDGYELLAFASDGKGRQALASGHAGWSAPEEEAVWKIYAFTDRTAYRPGETVQWKCMARIQDRSGYTTPGGKTVRATVNDPRGAKILETNLVLNAFGCAWSEVAVTGTMPLGSYEVNFQEGDRFVGSATLFRLEEFKLPEFKVAVSTPEQDGRKQSYLLGEEVEAEIRADYYSGGPVANASVEVVVRQRPYFRWWHPPRDFGWLYRDVHPPRPGWRGEGSVVKQETIRTDAAGRARVRFATPRSGQELEFTIEARVTDASRREITGTGSVRVGQQRYWVHLAPENRLRRPGQRAQVVLRAQDANDQPLGVTGKVEVVQRVWKERWINPLGQPVEGPALRAARAASAVWPPPPPADRPPWRCVRSGFEEKQLSVQSVTIATNGEADFAFTPAEPGYYAVRWRSPQPGGRPVTAECSLWVTTDKDADIGYLHAGGVEIVVDKDTFREGETAAVMLATPASGRWVLFGVEGEDLYQYQVVHLASSAKLVQLPVTGQHVPNIFLTAACFSDAQFSTDQQQVVVPPVQHYLSVTVTADRAAYQPREEARLQVAVTDHAGKPVEAEVALAVADEAVLYIQQDLAGDPREFFFGETRGQRIQTWSSFNVKPLRRIVPREEPPAETPDTWGGSALMEANEGIGFEGRGRPSGIRAMKSAGLADRMELASAPMAMPQAALREAEVGDAAGGPEPAVVVRSDFRATALWKPDLVTDDRGRAAAALTLPDSLTTWAGKARVLTKDNRFGIADVSFQARLPLTCRLQAPRFFVVGDTCTVSAVIQNNTDGEVPVSAVLEATGLQIRNAKPEARTIPPRGDTRVDWTVAATAAGEAKLQASARGERLGDAMEKTYTVHDHGLEVFVGTSTKMRGEAATVVLDLPAERRAGSTELVVQVAPSIAATLLDALPYLANYPYGCTEQTMSRFLPSVVVAKTLKDLGLQPEAVADRLFGGIEPENRTNRVPTIRQLDGMVEAGLNRLYEFQHADGGWGWWKDGSSDPYMTAYVVWGLALAREAGVEVRGGVVDRSLAWLEKQLAEAEDQPDLQAWEVHALSAHRRSNRFVSAAMQNLWSKRESLSAYTRALFLLASLHYGDPNKLAPVLARNLRDGVVKDDRPDQSILLQPVGDAGSTAALPTARWGTEHGWWRWSEGAVESTAFALKALLAADPSDDLIEPAMQWLVKNRRGAQWSNTRDTAFVVLALCDYLRVSQEVVSSLTYEVQVNGHLAATRVVTPGSALGEPGRFVADPAWLRDGPNEIRVARTQGEGPLYLSAWASYYSLEEPVPPAGHELFLNRQYFKIVPRPTLLKGVGYDRVPLHDGEAVRSGERIEVRVAVETKNDYTYLVFEDLKPAGFEAVEVRSGEPVMARQLTAPAGVRRFTAGQHDMDASDYTGASRSLYPEWRDRKVALFADSLPQGVWELGYTLRAETPGRFHALPLTGHAMYVPEIRAHGAEVRVVVEDQALPSPPAGL